MWTDARGTQRTGEVIDTVTVIHPQAGRTVATLYLVPANDRLGDRAYYTLEMHVGGKAHEYRMGSLEEGQKRMAQLRTQYPEA